MTRGLRLMSAVAMSFLALQVSEAANMLRSVATSSDVDCVLGAWAPTCECDAKTLLQEFKRPVLVPPAGSGRQCDRVAEMRQCFPVHCRMSAWSPWSDCDADGYKERKRDMEVAPRYGGRPCPNDTQRIKCRPVDCVVCKWSSWVCDERTGMQTRTRHVTRMPSDGGAPCPPVVEVKPCNPMDCVLDDDYEAWTECDENGIQVSRQKIKTPARFGGKECVPDERKAICPPKDCEMSGWSDWSECDEAGVKIRTRNVTKEPQYHGKACGPVEEFGTCPPEDCELLTPYEDINPWGPCLEQKNGSWIRSKELGIKKQPRYKGAACLPWTLEELCVPEDCQMAPWGNWSECDTNGKSTRTRTILKNPKFGGVSCEKTEEEKFCPVDCVVEEDVSFGECKEDGSGLWFRYKTKHIKIHAAYGGRQCPDEKELIQKQPCAKEDCVLGEWGEWSKCDAKGIKRRTRAVVKQPKYGGKTCDKTEEEKSCKLDNRTSV